MNFPIDPIDLSDERKVELENIMRAGNTILQELHLNVRKNLYRSRKDKEKETWTKWEMSPKKVSRSILANALLKEFSGSETKTLHFFGEKISNSDLFKIKNVYDIQYEMIAGYIKVVGNIIKKWKKYHHDVTAASDELLSEGMKVLLECIWYYKENYKFTTYVYYAVHRKICNVCAKSNPLSERTTKAAKLLRDYNKVKNSFNGPCNFEEVCDKMNLSYEERVELERMQVGVIGCLDNHALYAERVNSDYSSRALNFGDYSVVAKHASIGNIIRKQKDDFGFNYEKVIEKAHLSEVERIVLNKWIEADTDRWRAAAGDDLGCSRQYIGQICKRIQEKLKLSFESVLSEES
jgi:DNA-directed RNA polymerase specialized sigma subunit